jgi:hypothetical protein
VKFFGTCSENIFPLFRPCSTLALTVPSPEKNVSRNTRTCAWILALYRVYFFVKSANSWRNSNCFTALCVFLVQIQRFRPVLVNLFCVSIYNFSNRKWLSLTLQSLPIPPFKQFFLLKRDPSVTLHFQIFFSEDSKYTPPHFEIVTSVPIDTLRGRGGRHYNRVFGVFHTAGRAAGNGPSIRVDLSTQWERCHEIRGDVWTESVVT